MQTLPAGHHQPSCKPLQMQPAGHYTFLQELENNACKSLTRIGNVPASLAVYSASLQQRH
jgi:hypothetical protein